MSVNQHFIGTRNSIDIRKLVRAGLRQPSDSLIMRWHSSQQDQLAGHAVVTMLDSNRLQITHHDSDMPEEILDLSYSETAFGGQRAWFVCSKLGCGKRVAVLHAAIKGFRCRHCSHLAYQSQLEQPYDRLLRQVRRARHHVGGDNNILAPFPTKPKGMHWRTYDALAQQEMALLEATGTASRERWAALSRSRQELQAR